MGKTQYFSSVVEGIKIKLNLKQELLIIREQLTILVFPFLSYCHSEHSLLYFKCSTQFELLSLLAEKHNPKKMS
jgi:hypothetical protein